MADLSREEMHRLARLGAQARLDEIHREEALIRKAFPELFTAGTRPVRAFAVAPGDGVGDAPIRRRKRSKVSPAMRKVISERMTKYWAEWRKKNKKS